MIKNAARTGVCLMIGFVFASFASGQTALVVDGRVVDRNGDVVIGASVSLKDVRSGRSMELKTDETGRFRFPVSSKGVYSLKVAAEGFESSSRRLRARAGKGLTIVLAAKNVAEVVSVTSNYLAGTLQALERTAGSIQTIGPEELENSRVFNFSEALRKIAGVSIRNEEGFGLRPNISIRGSNPTRSRKVLILEDGIPLSYAPYGDNSSYYHPPIERFESVEVLKGSGQIEYGPVTVAGVVNYITPNPSDEPRFSLKLIGGNRDYFNGSAGFSGSFGSTGVLVNLTRKQGEGSRDNIRSGINDLSLKIVRPLNAANILVFKYSHFNEDSRITYSGLTEREFAEDPRQNPFRNDDLDFFREGFSIAHTGVFSPRFSVTTNFYTSYFSRDWWRQSSNSSQRPNRLGSDPDCLSMADLHTTCGIKGTPRDFRTTGVEPRFTASYDMGPVRNETSFGFRFHYETQNRRAFNGDLPWSRGGEMTENNLRSALAVSGFVQNRFIFGRFSLTPGIRIERVSYERRNLLNGSRAKTGLTQFVPGVGVAYNAFDNTTVFAGIHRGFAPPSTSDILTNSGGVVDLDSELSWNLEAGIRTRFLDSVSLEAALFRNDFENQIVPASVAGGTGSTRTNAGRTVRQGFELSTRIDSRRLFKTAYNFYFQSAYTFLRDARYGSTRFSGVRGFGDVLITGNRLPYTPKHLATSSIGFDYGGLNAFVENVFVGKQFTDDLNTIDPITNGQRGVISSQNYLNATVNYYIEEWRSTVFFTSKNVLDKLYVVDRTRGIYPSGPRLLQIGWKWEFGN